MLTPVFRAKVEQNRLVFEDQVTLSGWLNQFIGKQVEVTIKKLRRPRSTGKPDELGNQNGYYRGVIVPISAKELGYSQNEMHEIFISQCSPYIYKDFNGKKVAIKIRTSDMDTVQMMNFTDDCRKLMAEMNIIIPDPEKVV